MLFATPAAWAWGCKGHETVGFIAERHLNPDALSMVNQLLRNNPIDPKLVRFCQDAVNDLMADAATWADDVRAVRPETGAWHFIDIPRGASQSDIARYCPDDGCIIKAIAEQLAILRAPGGDPQQKADALRFLIHFIGDLHQPLHTTTNNDRGGNCVPVVYMGTPTLRRDPTTENYTPNLHGVWDTNMLENMSQGAGPQELAREIDQEQQSRIPGWQQGGTDVNQWAWEGHVVAEQFTYGKLPKAIPVETPQEVSTCADANNIAERMLKLDEHVEAPYQEAVGPVIRQQLEKAGVRLAMLLNQIWP